MIRRLAARLGNILILYGCALVVVSEGPVRAREGGRRSGSRNRNRAERLKWN